MATELTDRQKFYKILPFQSKLSCLCKQKDGSFIHIMASPHLINKIQKLKIIILFKYRLPWQPNHQIVRDFAKNKHFQSKISPLNKGFDCLFMYILCN